MKEGLENEKIVVEEVFDDYREEIGAALDSRFTF